MSFPVAHIESFGEGPPELLIEVPHGADEQTHYDALAPRLASPLPERLEKFFWVNTDVGAYALGRSIAEQAGVPTVVVRCLIPRTFIDVNRLLEGAAGMTPGLQPYITDPHDQAFLRELHLRYTATVEALYAEIPRAVIPHTYAPRTVPIATVDADIVKNLEHCYQPSQIALAPLRPQVDLITDTPEGVDLSPPGVAEALMQRLVADGFEVERGDSYNLHPATMGRVWSERRPGTVLCFEVRRDLVTDWNPFRAKALRMDAVSRLAAHVVEALG